MLNNKKNIKKPLTIVILAAGLGTRLGILTKDKPKTLVLVNGKPIISYSLAWARLLNPKKVVIVGGYLFPLLKKAVTSLDSRAVLVENKNFSTTQRMASLLAARGEIEGDLAVFDGDFIYHRTIAGKIAPHLKREMKIFCTEEEHPLVQLDMMIQTDEDNRLIDMSKELKEYKYYFNSFFYCPGHLINSYFKNAIHTIQRIGIGKTHLEDAIVECAKNGLEVRAIPLGQPRWIEVDTPHEHIVAEQMVSEDPRGYFL